MANPETSVPSSQGNGITPSRTAYNRSLTAPDRMAVNGHFASGGQNGHASFEHGVQVIDEDKEFKYVSRKWFHLDYALTSTVRPFLTT